MLADLFNPVKPPEVREEAVSVRHIFMGTEPKTKPRPTYAVRTAEQKERRRELQRQRERAGK